MYTDLFSLFFIDSGHGGQTPDLNGDEVDGWDEGKSPFSVHSFSSYPT